MRTLPLPALFALSPLLAACSATVGGSVETADADANATSAVVVVERTVGASDARASAVARFVRMRSGAVDDDALRLVGATVDFPALGSCATALATRKAGTARALELLDVGAISLEANGLRTNLQARQIPDVVDLLSGVVYATPTADADTLPPGSVYVLRAAGSVEQEVAPFAVSASAPDEPSQVRIAGQDVGPERNDVVALPAAFGAAAGAGVAVEVSWEPGAADDFVYVDVSGQPDVGAQTAARCLFSDVGRATLTPAAFGEMTNGTIAIHRLHREPFRVKGVDAGEVRFDFARVVAFTRL
jgi:hypothetical protein